MKIFAWNMPFTRSTLFVWVHPLYRKSSGFVGERVVLAKLVMMSLLGF